MSPKSNQSVAIVALASVAVAVSPGRANASAEKDASAPVLVDAVAARVGDKAITVSDVMGLVQPAIRRLASAYSGEDLKVRIGQVYRDGVTLSIEKSLILTAYEKQENKLPEWVFRNRADSIVEQSFAGDRDSLLAALSSDYVRYDDWLQGLREQVIVATMRREFVDRRVRVGPLAIREAYETNKAQYAVADQVDLRIITMGKGATDDELKKRLEQMETIRRDAVAGKDFATLARSYSEHRSKTDGGSLGWVEPGKALRRELANAVKALHPGEVSPVVEAAGDLYVLKVEGRREGGVQPFEQVQADIERDLRRREVETIYRAWISGLERGVYVSRADVDPFK